MNNKRSEDALNTTRIEDFISGGLVRETPEETDAVQVFAHRLVEDYDYQKILFRPTHNSV